MQHDITISGFDFAIEIIDTGRWNKADQLFEDVLWEVVEFDEASLSDSNKRSELLKAYAIVDPLIIDHSDEMEEALQKACKKEMKRCTNQQT